MNLEASNRLSQAHLRLEFIEFALSSMGEHALMGTEQASGLAFFLKNIRDGMEGALECDFYERTPDEKVVKLA